MKNTKLIALFVLLISIFLSASFFIFKNFFRHAMSLGLIGLFLINFASNATFFMPTPALIGVVSAGNLYPPLLVAIASSLGATAGDTINFLFGLSGRHLINHKLAKNKWFIFLEKKFKKHGNWLLFLFAFVPNPIFDIAGLIAGIFKFSLFRFFILVFVGRFIRYYILAKFGSLL